jgi:hypothetical protein
MVTDVFESVAYFEVLFRHVAGKTDRNHKNQRSEYPIAYQKFDSGTSELRFQGNTHTQTPWSESASELYRPSDRHLSAK